ncbi:MAG: hypothetical protein WC792_04105 [Candidatus Micrarchaeia archaeon]|jgi:hypothetical protein
MTNGGTVFVDVALAADVKAAITDGDDTVTFKKDATGADLKKFILNSADNDFLLLTKTVGSDLTIIDAKKIDDAMIAKLLF